MSDPLRNGRIFQLDPNMMKRMRPHIPTNHVLPGNSLGNLRKDELIPGIKAKFDDVFRSTPNPLNALLGSTSPFLSNTPSSSSSSNFNSFQNTPSASVSSISSKSPIIQLPQHQQHQQTPTRISSLTSTSTISISTPSIQPQQLPPPLPPPTTPFRSPIAPQTTASVPIIELPPPTPKTTPIPPPTPPPPPPILAPVSKPPSPPSPAVASESDSEQQSPPPPTTTPTTPSTIKETKSTNSTGTGLKSILKPTSISTPQQQKPIEGRSKSETKQVAPKVNERLATTESKKPKNKPINRHRVCDSLMMLFGSSPTTKESTTNLNTRASTTTSNQQSIGTIQPKETSKPYPTINQKLFASPEKVEQKPQPSPKSERISKRTRSKLKKTSQQSVLAQLSIPKPSEPIQQKTREINQREKRKRSSASLEVEQDNSEEVEEDEEEEEESSIEQKKKPTKKSKPSTSHSTTTTTTTTTTVQNSKTTKQSTKRNTHPKKVEDDDFKRNPYVDLSIWKSEEIIALQQAFRASPVDDPLFWDVVAQTMNNILKDYGFQPRTSDECADQWYVEFKDQKEPTKKRTIESTRLKSFSNEDMEKRPKRITQAQKKQLLEEAFIGEADDIFEAPSNNQHSTMSITPHKEAIQLSSLDSIFAMKSPVDIQPENDRNETKQKKSSKNNIFQEKETHWEATYVGKLKKQQKSNKGTTAGGKKPVSNSRNLTRLRRVSDGLIESSEITVDERGRKTQTGLQVEARLNSRGKVDVNLKGDRLDDEEDEEDLREWVNQNHRDIEEEDEEEGDDEEEDDERN